jgi:hypothetical protein
MTGWFLLKMGCDGAFLIVLAALGAVLAVFQAHSPGPARVTRHGALTAARAFSMWKYDGQMVRESASGKL